MTSSLASPLPFKKHCLTPEPRRPANGAGHASPDPDLVPEKQRTLVKSDHNHFIEYTEAMPLSSNNII